MTQEEKELLLRDLSARIFEGVKIKVDDRDNPLEINYIRDECVFTREFSNLPYWIEQVKPYLRPLSSLTSKDKAELNAITEEFGDNWLEATTPEERWKYCFLNSSNEIDWLISHHIDYRGLIPMGLALEALEGMYKEK